MSIRRGNWQPESKKIATNSQTGRKSVKYGAMPAPIKGDVVTGESNSSHYLRTRNNIPVNDRALSKLSTTRQEEILQGRASSYLGFNKNGSSHPEVIHSASYKTQQNLIKQASTSTSTSVSSSASADVIRVAPEVYSPLYQIANLQLPRDRITMNAWNRVFYDTHPLVHNCINLHSTYPISKINIKCKNHKVEQFFQEMIDEMGLLNILHNLSLEWWKLGECTKGDCNILMGDGTTKKIIDIKIGDIVLTHLGNKKKVIELKKHYTTDGLYEIYFVGSNIPLYLTANHPIWAVKKESILCTIPSRQERNQKCWCTEDGCAIKRKYTHQDGTINHCMRSCGHEQIQWMYDWLETKKISAGDFGLRPINSCVNEKFSQTISKEWAKLLGYFCSEGCYRKNKDGYKIALDISNSNEEINKDIETLCTKLSLNLRKTKQRATFDGKDLGYDMIHNIISGNNIVEQFYYHVGEYSHQKVLSNEFMEADFELQREFITSYANGDGCIDKAICRFELYTGSQKLGYQLQHILGRLGICANISKSNRFKTAGGSKQYIVTEPLYTIRVCAGEIQKKITGMIAEKQQILNTFKLSKKSRYQLFNKNLNGIATKIEQIKHIPYEGWVYNIEVEDDHSYVAEGLAVHNCFAYAEMDETRGQWKTINILNPDYIHVKMAVLGGEPVISMRPDAALMRLVMSNNPADIQLRQQISEEILYHIRRGNNIPLDNFHVSHLKMISSPYDIHGTSIIVSVYKDLMYYDKLRESKYAQADSLINPITLIKLGGANDGDYRASEADIQEWRNTIEAAQYDKDYKIITHAGVSIERSGAAGQVIDIANDLAFTVDNILYGLITPKAVLTQEGATFSNASIGLEVLKQRYENFRTMMASWLVRKIFAPVSEIQNFYEYIDGKKRLIVPSIDWNQMILFDMDNYIGSLKELSKEGKVSKETLFRSLGLSVEEERRKIRHEAIQDAILVKELEIIKSMSIPALKSLGVDDVIVEPTEAPLPGTRGSEESGIPGAVPPELPGMPELAPTPELAAPAPSPETPAATETPAAPAAPTTPTG